MSEIQNGRHTKQRFGWVKRLMQGQARTPHAPPHPPTTTKRGKAAPNDTIAPSALSQAVITADGDNINQAPTQDSAYTTRQHESRADDCSSSGSDDDDHSRSHSMDGDSERDRNYSDRFPSSNDSNYRRHSRNEAQSEHSEMGTIQSDNISTIPLKSIISVPSTKSPSILSDPNMQGDQSSYNASTTETSLAPSSIVLQSPQNTALLAASRNDDNRDNESVVTLASSTRRIRRRSIDTNCSTAGIPPASIMERLTGQPGSGGVTYARSVEDVKSDRSGN
ncbi:hypothetical protein DICA3_E20494 [Diutina catenulata]